MEQWKDIPGYEGLYQASTDGRIRTCEGKTTSSARFPHRVWKQRVLKQKLSNKHGRRDARVSLWKDRKEKTWLVSRLVAMTWCNNYSPELTVNHIDGNPLNNACANLEWVTRKTNIQKGFETGLYSTVQKRVLLSNGLKVLEFKSMSEASRFLGKSNGYISQRVKSGIPILDEYTIIPF